MHDFIENLQLGGRHKYNTVHSVHNEGRPKFDGEGKRVKSYEEKLEEQYRTIESRRPRWPGR